MLVSIPKMADLALCNNWRGISVLDVARKMFTKIIQHRLQELVEEVMPDSCGVRVIFVKYIHALMHV